MAFCLAHGDIFHLDTLHFREDIWPETNRYHQKMQHSGCSREQVADFCKELSLYWPYKTQTCYFYLSWSFHSAKSWRYLSRMCPYATIFVLSSVCRASFKISTHFISKIPLRNGRFIGVTGAVPVGPIPFGFGAFLFVHDRSFWLLPEMCCQSSNSFSISILFFF